jgi:DNA-binding transcriptional ArsR family regulator
VSDDAVRQNVGPDSTDDLFRVLADPTRRRILDLLADHGALTVSDLAARFPHLVASGISKHLMALRATGLVTATRQGRNQLYAIDADAMTRALSPWLARYETYWAGALTRLREVAEKPEGDVAGSE